MKRVAFSLLSAAFLSVAIAPISQAAQMRNTDLNARGGIHPVVLSRSQTASENIEPPIPVQPIPPLEQMRLNRLDRGNNLSGSLNSIHQQVTSSEDLTPHSTVQMSSLQQMRLNRLDRSNS